MSGRDGVIETKEKLKLLNEHIYSQMLALLRAIKFKYEHGGITCNVLQESFS